MILRTLIALLFFVPAGRLAAHETPNFVIIIADDVSWNDVGAYGHPHIRTPHIDRLAKEGVRFDAAFLTTSSCSPSRASIMTGRYPHNTGAAELHQPLPEEQAIFPELLQKAGYYTASAGKWHLGNAAKRGFDTIVGGGPSGCEKWVTVLKERPQGQPFFLWLAAIDAHRPYREGIIEEPHSPETAVVPPYLPDRPEVRRDLAQYYDEIGRLDDYVGRVVAELQEQGQLDRTLILIMADNGRPFPRCKTTLYDSGIRTPFIVRYPPLVKPGRVTDHLVSAVDIAPTLLELAEAEPSPTFEGQSFVTLLKDPQRPTRDFVFAEHNWHDYQAHERSVRDQRFLYIRNAFPDLSGSPPADAVRSPTYRVMREMHAAGELTPRQAGTFITPRPAEELYDLRDDPHSLKNLIGDPKYAQQQQRLRQELTAWAERTGDQVPQKPTPDRFDRATGKPLK